MSAKDIAKKKCPKNTKKKSASTKSRAVKTFHPSIPIDWVLVDRYAESGATGQEIAAVIGVCETTFYNQCKKQKKVGWVEYAAEKRCKGYAMLKKSMLDIAVEDKNVTMLIWLSKVVLEMRENTPVQTKEAVDQLKSWSDAINEPDPIIEVY